MNSVNELVGQQVRSIATDKKGTILSVSDKTVLVNLGVGLPLEMKIDAFINTFSLSDEVIALLKNPKKKK